jgi:hypothetical protein
MQAYQRLTLLAIFAPFLLFVISNTSFAELIEPTRTLEGAQERPGRLTVLSEPPGLEITLDGNSLGKTPAFLLEVEEGIHTVYVKNSKTQIYIEPGKTLKLSFHKGEFIFIPVAEKEVEKQPEPEAKGERGETGFERPRDPVRFQNEKNKRQAIERFNKFIDGTQEHF